MLQSQSMLGELVSSCLPWLLEVGEMFLLPSGGNILPRLEDTPWDEPTRRSYEFGRYVSGSFIDDAPWDRIPASLFCSSRRDTPPHPAHLLLALITGLLTVNPQDRMTLADAFQHPWVLTYVLPCAPSRRLSDVHRQSQLASQGPVALAERLTESLRNTGDLDLVEIDLQSYVISLHSSHAPFSIQSPTENRLYFGTMINSCSRRHGAPNSLNRSCCLCVFLTLKYVPQLSQRRSRRLRVALVTHPT